MWRKVLTPQNCHSDVGSNYGDVNSTITSPELAVSATWQRENRNRITLRLRWEWKRDYIARRLLEASCSPYIKLSSISRTIQVHHIHCDFNSVSNSYEYCIKLRMVDRVAIQILNTYRYITADSVQSWLIRTICSECARLKSVDSCRDSVVSSSPYSVELAYKNTSQNEMHHFASSKMSSFESNNFHVHDGICYRLCTGISYVIIVQ